MAFIRDYQIVETSGISEWHASAGASAAVLKGLNDASLDVSSLNWALPQTITFSVTGVPTVITFGIAGGHAADPLLATDIRDQINATPLAGATASLDAGNRLTITSGAAGSTIYVKITAITAALVTYLGLTLNQVVYGKSIGVDASDIAQSDTTKGIEAFHQTDVVYYRVDNRPLLNLTDNDAILNSEIGWILTGYDAKGLHTTAFNTADRSFIATEGKNISFKFYAPETWTYDNALAVGFTYEPTTGRIQYLAAVVLAGVTVGDLFVDGAGNRFKIYDVDDPNDRVYLAKGLTVDNVGPYTYMGYIQNAKGRLEIYDDLFINGDLILGGQISETTVDEVLVEDKFIHLNINETGAGVGGGTGSSGLIVDRGITGGGAHQETRFIFNELADGVGPAWTSNNMPIYSNYGFYTNLAPVVTRIQGYYFGRLSEHDYIEFDSDYEAPGDKHAFVFKATDSVNNSWLVANKFDAIDTAPDGTYYFGLIANNDYIIHAANTFVFFEGGVSTDSIVEAGSFVSTVPTAPNRVGKYHFGAVGSNDYLEYDDAVTKRFQFRENDVVEDSVVAAGKIEETGNGTVFEEIHKTPVIVVGNGTTNWGDYNGESGLRTAFASASDITIYVKQGTYTLTADLLINGAGASNVTLIGEKDAEIVISGNPVGNVISIVNGVNITIKGFKITVKEDTSSAAITFDAGSSHCSLEDCTIVIDNDSAGLADMASSLIAVAGLHCTLTDLFVYVIGDNVEIADADLIYITGDHCTLKDSKIDLSTGAVAGVSVNGYGTYNGVNTFWVINSYQCDYTTIQNCYIRTGNQDANSSYYNNIILKIEWDGTNLGTRVLDNIFICGNGCDSITVGRAGRDSIAISLIGPSSTTNTNSVEIKGNTIVCGEGGNGCDDPAGNGSAGGYVYGIWSQNISINILCNKIVLACSGDGGAGSLNGGNGGQVMGINNEIGLNSVIYNIVIDDNIIGYDIIPDWTPALSQLSGDGGNAGAASTSGQGGSTGGIFIESLSTTFNTENVKITNNQINLYLGHTGISGTGGAVEQGSGSCVGIIFGPSNATSTNMKNTLISDNIINLSPSGICTVDSYAGVSLAIYMFAENAVDSVTGSLTITNNLITLFSKAAGGGPSGGNLTISTVGRGLTSGISNSTFAVIDVRVEHDAIILIKGNVINFNLHGGSPLHLPIDDIFVIGEAGSTNWTANICDNIVSCYAAPGFQDWPLNNSLGENCGAIWGRNLPNTLHGIITRNIVNRNAGSYIVIYSGAGTWQLAELIPPAPAGTNNFFNTIY